MASHPYCPALRNNGLCVSFPPPSPGYLASVLCYGWKCAGPEYPHTRYSSSVLSARGSILMPHAPFPMNYAGGQKRHVSANVLFEKHHTSIGYSASWLSGGASHDEECETRLWWISSRANCHSPRPRTSPSCHVLI